MKAITKGLIVLWALNLADAISTHVALNLGIAEELNPLMRMTFEASPALFWVTKFTLLGFGTFGLVKGASIRSAKIGLIICNVFYGLVLLGHAHIWYLYLDSL